VSAASYRRGEGQDDKCGVKTNPSRHQSSPLKTSARRGRNRGTAGRASGYHEVLERRGTFRKKQKDVGSTSYVRNPWIERGLTSQRWIALTACSDVGDPKGLLGKRSEKKTFPPDDSRWEEKMPNGGAWGQLQQVVRCEGHQKPKWKKRGEEGGLCRWRQPVKDLSSKQRTATPTGNGQKKEVGKQRLPIPLDLRSLDEGLERKPAKKNKRGRIEESVRTPRHTRKG